MKNKILILSLLITIFCINQSFGQNVLFRTCTGQNPSIKQAKILLTKEGDINFIACAGRTVLLNGSVLNGTGTVTSVGLSLPNIFSVASSPVTSTGTITATLASQSQNLFFASPNGSSGAPVFRGLVAADIPSLDVAKITTGTFASSFIPSLDASKITTGTIGTARLGSGSASSSTFLHGDNTWAALAAGDIPNLAASKITSGTITPARLGTGTTDSTTFLRGDGTWVTNSAGYQSTQLITTNITATNQTEFIEVSNAGTSTVVSIPTMTTGQIYTIFSYDNGSNGKLKLTEVGAGIIGQNGQYLGLITSSNSINCVGVFRIYKVLTNYYLDAIPANCTVTA